MVVVCPLEFCPSGREFRLGGIFRLSFGGRWGWRGIFRSDFVLWGEIVLRVAGLLCSKNKGFALFLCLLNKEFVLVPTHGRAGRRDRFRRQHACVLKPRLHPHRILFLVNWSPGTTVVDGPTGSAYESLRYSSIRRSPKRSKYSLNILPP